MHSFFTYLIEVNIAIALFYLLYIIVLKRDTFLKLRRFFFLSAIVFSLLYPFWPVPALANLWSSSLMLNEAGTTVLIDGSGTVEMIEADEAVPATIPWARIILLVYISVTSIFLLRFMMQLVSIFRMRMRCEKQIFCGTSVYQLKQNITPFSFFHWIFIHSENHSKAELSQILLHEQTHARQWHSVDIVLVEMVYLSSWWNPFVWLIKREMAMNLEYLADNGVLCEGIDRREYQYHLLRLTYHEAAVQIVNNFNVSQLKQRIMMMNKTKSPELKVAKYLLILPLVFSLILANSCVNQDKERVKDVTETPVPNETAKGDENFSDVFEVVEVSPQFPGGLEELKKFLSNNVQFPKEAEEMAVQGRVIVRFIVEKDGTPTNFNVIRGIDPLLDAEAIRVLKQMPKWIPGKQRGEPARVTFTLPVSFRLQEGSKDNDPVRAQDSPGDIFEVVENQPQFPGGVDALNKWLGEKVRYPIVAVENGIQGRVIVRFVVEKDGSLSNIQVMRGVDSSLDKEAIRVVGEMPKWKPGTQRGHPVRVYFTLPVIFRLQQ